MIVKELIARLGLDIDESAFSKGEAAIAGLAQGFVAFSTAALGAVAVGLVALTKSSANAADHIKKLSQATGVDSIALQEFGYSADLAGVSLDEMAHGLEHLAKSGVKDVRTEVLKLADRFQKMPDDGRKVELAMDKFGRAGARMIPWLNSGAKGIADLAQEARELGIVFDKDAQNAAETFNDNVTRLGYSFVGLRNVIGAAVLPVLNKFVLSVLSFIKIARANWTPIVQQVTLALKTLAFVMGGALLAAFTANIAAIASTVSWYAALSVAAVASGVRAALAWAAAAAPIVILGALFAALLLVIEDVYVFLKGGDSLIGELGPKWTKLVDDFDRPHAGDPWWLAALRTAVGYATDLHKLWLKLGLVSDEQKAPGQAEIDAFTWGRNLGRPAATPGALINGQFGGGASPAASASVKYPRPATEEQLAFLKSQGLLGAPSGPATVNNHVTHNIVVHASPGMSAQEIAGKVSEQLDGHFDRKLREAAVGAAK